MERDDERVVAEIDLGSILFAVVALDSDGQLLKPLIYGTAFCIGPGLFLTAGHVITNVLEDGGRVAVAQASDSGFIGKEADRSEVLPSHDVGLVQAKVAAPALLDWDTVPRSLLHDVSAAGFPFAVNRVESPPSFKVTMRGFKGYVQTRTQLWTVPGVPVGYEVSTTFPKGMSGAPLIDASGPVPTLKVIGMVLGNSEVNAFGEVSRFGIAIDIQAVAALRSDVIVGGTLGQLRERVVQGDGFRTDATKPFMQWEFRETIDPQRAANLVKLVCQKAEQVWAASLQAATGGDENLLILQTHRHIQEHLESVATLLADGVIESCKVHLRAAFEALLTLEYILEGDSINRAYAWLTVADVLDRIKMWERMDPSTPEGTRIRQLLADARIGLPESINAAAKRQSLMEMLEQHPRWKPAFTEYERLVEEQKSAGKRPQVAWFNLFGGPKGTGVRSLAYHLKHGAHYEFLYRFWSRRIHGTDVVQRVRPSQQGFRPPSIRNEGDVSQVLNFAVSFGLSSTRRVLAYYLPDESTALRQWYIEQFRPQWPLIAGRLPLDEDKID